MQAYADNRVDFTLIDLVQEGFDLAIMPFSPTDSGWPAPARVEGRKERGKPRRDRSSGAIRTALPSVDRHEDCFVECLGEQCRQALGAAPAGIAGLALLETGVQRGSAGAYLVSL